MTIHADSVPAKGPKVPLPASTESIPSDETDSTALDTKPFTSETEPTPLEALQIEQNDLVIFAEDGHFYLVPERAYKASPLPASLWAAPEFVVGLGAVAANLEFFQEKGDPPLDSLHELTKEVSCVVLNLASLVNDREKAGGRPRIDPKPKIFSRSQDERPPSSYVQGPIVDPRDLIIFDAHGDFYWVRHKEHLDPARCTPLPDELTSAPMLVAGLGTVLADIPFLPTVGCSCFLLNLASLRLGAKDAARLLYKAMKEADDRSEKLAKKPLEEKDRHEAAAAPAAVNSSSRGN